MQKLNLMLHCGANAANREQVNEVPTPEPTGTHYPVPHAELIDRTVDTLDEIIDMLRAALAEQT